MKEIRYVSGDATDPIGDGRKFIIHCCNDMGLWGAGFVVALSKKWKNPEIRYREWSREFLLGNKDRGDFCLGNVQFVRVEKDIVVANMIGQHGVGWKNGIPPIRYDSIEKCLKKVAKFATHNNAEVHAPRFGAGLAGGDWNKIEELIVDRLIHKGIGVTIYDF